MDASPSVDSEADELAELRRRAYGPDADIDGTSLHRLAELEAAERAAASMRDAAAVTAAAVTAAARDALSTTASVSASATATAPATAVVLAETPAEAGASPEAAVAGTPAESSGSVAEEASARSRLARALARLREIARLRWVIAVVCVAATALVAWGVSDLATRPDARLAPVAFSAEDRDNLVSVGSLPAWGIDESSLQRYEEYDQLSVWSATARGGTRCLLLQTQQLGLFSVNCVPPGLDPSVDFWVYDGMPSALRQSLPVGSTVRFVLKGSTVEVTAARALDQA